MIDKVDDNGTIYNYSYDKLGNITEVKKDNTLTNKYYYDMYSHLIKEDDLVNNLTKTYTYDNYGNILNKKTYTYNTTNLIKEDTYQYNNSSWQDLLTKFNNESITYDEIGNPLTIGNKTLTWMNGRELSTYSDGTNNISYKYNLNGIRTSKIVNGIKTNYILEGTSIIFEDRNGTMIYYIYNGDELLGFVYNSKTYYYHKNMFGDIIGILDSNYNEIVKYSYDSFGALINITDNSNINLGIINPFRYRSYYYDTETGLYYLNSRYYNPQIGRFINADGIIAGQGVISNNIFIYCGNNFINGIDKNGNSWKWLDKLNKAVFNLGREIGRKARIEYEVRKSSLKDTLKKVGNMFGVKSSTSTETSDSYKMNTFFGSFSYTNNVNSSVSNNLSEGKVGNIVVNSNSSNGSIEGGIEFGMSRNTISISPNSFEAYSGTPLTGITVGVSNDSFPSLDIGIVANYNWNVDENGNFSAGSTSSVKFSIHAGVVAVVLLASVCPVAVPFALGTL